MEAQNISREELAQHTNTYTGYLTELFRGTKSLNFDILAKMDIAPDVAFRGDVVEVGAFHLVILLMCCTFELVDSFKGIGFLVAF